MNNENITGRRERKSVRERTREREKNEEIGEKGRETWKTIKEYCLVRNKGNVGKEEAKEGKENEVEY